MKIIISVIVLLIIVVIIEIRRELSTFRTVHYEIRIPGMDGKKKVLFLSDLHNHVYGWENERLLEAVKKEEPDLILIGGDMLVGKERQCYRVALEFVKRLPEICPVYYVNGNHEQRMKEDPEHYEASFAEYRQELIESGVWFLENESVYLKWKKVDLKITGLEIPLRCYTHFYKEYPQKEEILDRIGEQENGVYEILLAHNPSYMNCYLERGADLILSGHLHGGIVRIPGVAGAISPSFEIFPKYSGDHYREGDTDIVVSKGLGTHTFNIRLFNPAEIVILHFEGENLV